MWTVKRLERHLEGPWRSQLIWSHIQQQQNAISHWRVNDYSTLSNMLHPPPRLFNPQFFSKPQCLFQIPPPPPPQGLLMVGRIDLRMCKHSISKLKSPQNTNIQLNRQIFSRRKFIAIKISRASLQIFGQCTMSLCNDKICVTFTNFLDNAHTMTKYL